MPAQLSSVSIYGIKISPAAGCAAGLVVSWVVSSLLAVAVTAAELVHAAGGIHQLLFAGEERV